MPFHVASIHIHPPFVEAVVHVPSSVFSFVFQSASIRLFHRIASQKNDPHPSAIHDTFSWYSFHLLRGHPTHASNHCILKPSQHPFPTPSASLSISLTLTHSLSLCLSTGVDLGPLLGGGGREGTIEVFGFAKKKPSVPFCPGRCGRIFSGQKRHSAFLPQNSPERGGSRPLRVLYDTDYLIPKRRMQRFGANQNLASSSVL